MFLLSVVSSVVLHAASLKPAVVPAAGVHEAILTLDTPGAIHFSARSGSGTACEFIDRVRGPFQRAGEVGKRNCELDLLLDAGEYKVRFESPLKGRGEVALKVTPFVEVNSTPVKLAPGVLVETSLTLGQQATYGLSVAVRGVPMVRLSGRNAGDVRLWRNGEWLEPLTLRHAVVASTPGYAQTEWWLDHVVEPGDYTLVAYGRDPATATAGSVDDSLTVEMGFRRPVTSATSFALPASGLVAVEVGQRAAAAFVSLSAPPSAPVSLTWAAFNETSGLRTLSSCVIAKSAPAAACGLRASANAADRVVALLRGPRGTAGTLEWAPLFEGSRWDVAEDGGGLYGSPTSTLAFHVSRPTKALVALHDVPVDSDAAPLGCQLEEVRDDARSVRVLARSAVRVGDGEGLDASFNYDERGAVVWFDTARAGRYRIRTEGGRKTRCEVFSSRSDGALDRVAQPKRADAAVCDEVIELGRGAYQVQLFGGVSGIEKLIVREDSRQAVKPSAVPASCTLPSVSLETGDYRLVATRTGNVALRGLAVWPLPLALQAAVHLTVEPKATLSLPLQAGAGFIVSGTGEAALSCRLERAGVTVSGASCALPAMSSADTLTLRTTSATAVSVTLYRPSALPASSSLVSYAPAPSRLPRVAPEKPAWFDFERQQTHAVVFDVDAPGLYNVTTLGLLSTSCRLRTPVVDTVAENTNGGRGRNCLIQTYLQKGRYLFSATAQGASRGRGALFLIRKPPTSHAGLIGEGQSFFRSDANELAQQSVVVRSAGDYSLRTTAPGASLECRLDDAAGWPVEAVPSPCVGQRALKAGSYVWTQLPLTVESMRRTTLERVRQPIVLKGNAPHAVEAFTWYDVQLGPDGQDEFTFSLEGETALDVVLTQGMQGRILRREAGQPPKAVEVIPARASGDDASQVEQVENEESPSEDEGGEASEGEDEPESSPPRPTPQARRVPPPPSGVSVTLPAGAYSLVTQHSQGDVAVSYRLHFGSAVLMPGMRRMVPVPSTLKVAIPRDGTLRLRTEGEADVRCRLFDASGRLVVQGADNGPDWNCALAEPMAAGVYSVSVESETQSVGETSLSLELPSVEDGGVVADGQRLNLARSVVELAVPSGDAVHEVSISTASNKGLFSCAVVGPAGVVQRMTRVNTCRALVLPKAEPWKLRLWTTDGAVAVQARVATRAVVSTGTRVQAGQALQVSVGHAGRYQTAAQAWCLREATSGAFESCGPEASLEAGSVVFAGFGTAAIDVPLTEVRAEANGVAASQALQRRPFIQRLAARQPVLFTLEARVPWGETTPPACRFDGPGVLAELGDVACFAVSRFGSADVTMRLWAPSDTAVDATVVRNAVALPSKVEALVLGRRQLTFSKVGAWSLEAPRTRVEVTMPKASWAVLLSASGDAIDFCSPHDDVHHCAMSGPKGTLVLAGAGGVVDVTAIAVESEQPQLRFSGLHEARPSGAGSMRLPVAAAREARQVTVTGALRCTTTFSSGERRDGCGVGVPANAWAEVAIEHGTEPVRAVLSAPNNVKQASWGFDLAPVAGPALPMATAVSLSGGRLERSLVVAAESVVRITAESGVCALVKGADVLAVDGMGSGCDLARLLGPGTYRVLVRPFAQQQLSGGLRWLAEPVTRLNEGIAAESLLAPGEARVFTFDTTGSGRVGLGLQSKREGLTCAVYDTQQHLVGEGCQQYLALDKGRWVLTVRNPPGPEARAIAIRPVVLGLSGEAAPIPESYLNDFFNRLGDAP